MTTYLELVGKGLLCPLIAKEKSKYQFHKASNTNDQTFLISVYECFMYLQNIASFFDYSEN